uniref:Uncharacterized protein n=1 Tax=Arion vulgaris TaxID=1028688 RepID=A0A0B7AD21_9EUPU
MKYFKMSELVTKCFSLFLIICMKPLDDSLVKFMKVKFHFNFDHIFIYPLQCLLFIQCHHHHVPV